MAKRKLDLAQKLRVFSRLSIPQLIFMGAAVFFAVALWVFLNGFVACWPVTPLPGMPPPNCSTSTGQPTAVATIPGATAPVQTASPTVSALQIALPPAWDGASRVNVLILGLRGGDNNQGCPD